MSELDDIVPGLRGLKFSQVVTFIDFMRSDKFEGHMAGQIDALLTATKEHREAIAQVVEVEKIVQAVRAAQEDRSRAQKELREAQEFAVNLKLEATTEATQILADAQRTVTETETDIAERTEALDRLSEDLERREQAADEKDSAATDLMNKAEDLHRRATAMYDDNKAKAQRMEQAALS